MKLMLFYSLYNLPRNFKFYSLWIFFTKKALFLAIYQIFQRKGIEVIITGQANEPTNRTDKMAFNANYSGTAHIANSSFSYLFAKAIET